MQWQPPPRWIIGVVVVEFLLAAAIFGMRPMVSYRALAMGASPAELGLLASSFALLALVFAVPLGWAVDRSGERFFIIAGIVLVALSAGATLLADGLFGLAASQAIMGVGQLAVVIGSHTLIANHGTAAGRIDRFGVYMSMAALGRAVGPVAGTIIASSDGTVAATDQVFVAGAATAAAALVVGAFIPSSARLRSTTTVPPSRARLGDALRRPGMRPALMAGMVVISSVTVLVAYLPAYGVERSLPPESVGLALAALALSQVVARINLGFVVRRLGHAFATAGSMALAAVALPLLSLPLSDLSLILVMAVVGAGLGLGQPLSLVWFATMTPHEIRGVVMGVRTTGNQLGQLCLPAVAGAVAGPAGVVGVAWCVGLLLLVAAADVARSRHTLDHGSSETHATRAEAGGSKDG